MTNPYILNAGFFLLNTLVIFYTYILIARFLLQLFKVDFFNPICQGVVRITDPTLNPMRKLLPRSILFDYSAIILAFTLQLVGLSLLSLFSDDRAGLIGLILVTLAATLNKILNFLIFAILAHVVISWLSHGGYNPLLEIINSISAPLLKKARKFLPRTGSLDFSPMLVIIALQLVIMLVIIPLRDFGHLSY